MIEVSIKANGNELAYIEIENVKVHDDDTSDHVVRFGVDRAKGAIGLHRRLLYNFPRTEYNVLALVLQALNTLDPNELRLEDDVSASDLARGFRRPRPALPREA